MFLFYYLNSTIEFLLIQLLGFILSKKAIEVKTEFLFISLGGIGDLVIAHLILNNDGLWKGKTVLLTDSKYKGMLKYYHGNVNLIYVNRTKYKFNILYRIKFLLYIRSMNIRTVVNLNRGRRLIDDQISLLSGAIHIHALTKSPDKLMKYYKKRVERKYDNIFFEDDDLNEVTKINFLIKTINKKIAQELPTIYYKSDRYENENSVVINPTSDNTKKGWPIHYYKEIVDYLKSRCDVNIYIVGKTSGKRSFFDWDGVINLVNETSIEEAISLILNTKLFIGGDTGLSHIAKSLNKSRIIITGGGGFGQYFPYGDSMHEKLIYRKLDCFGCEWNCNNEIPYKCLQTGTEEVISSINELLCQ